MYQHRSDGLLHCSNHLLRTSSLLGVVVCGNADFLYRLVPVFCSLDLFLAFIKNNLSCSAICLTLKVAHMALQQLGCLTLTLHMARSGVRRRFVDKRDEIFGTTYRLTIHFRNICVQYRTGPCCKKSSRAHEHVRHFPPTHGKRLYVDRTSAIFRP